MSGQRWRPVAYPVSDAIATRIREERRKRDWSQDELGEKCGIPLAVITNIEIRRTRDIGMDVLSMIASGLGVPLADLCPRADAVIRVELELFTEADALTLVRALRRHLRPKPKEES